MKSYKATKIAAYIGYITQAVVNNLSPLLFVTFSQEYGLSLEKLSLLITVNFVTQILTDLFSSKYILKIGYRKACIMAHVLATIGLLFLGILPSVLNPFAGLMVATVFCAVGGGLDEVIISPVIEAIPGDAKDSDMSLLHSFYSWGQMLVVLGSTAYFAIFGTDAWRVLPCIWSVIPLVCTIMFCFVPINELPEEEGGGTYRNLFANKVFWLLFVIMICAGASELGMSQWASYFAEQGLGVTKYMGDLLGPCLFAFFMGISRVIYGVWGNKIRLEGFMIVSGALCVICYFVAALAANPVIALLGCGLCGFSVGIMWPGTYSVGTAKMPLGGTRMFALLAFAGDIGCTSGPDVVGVIAGRIGDIRKGMMFGSVFPIILIIGVCLLEIITRNDLRGNDNDKKSA